MTVRADIPCVSGEDLTAFAHGEGDPKRRAEIAGHVFRCERCREGLGESRETLALLSLLRPASVAAGARAAQPARALRPGVFVGLAAMAAAVVFAVVSWWPSGAPTPPPQPVAAHAAEVGEPVSGGEVTWSSPDVFALLRAQQPDGRWSADAGFGGAKNDEAATALALLALIPDHPAVLESGDVARSVAAATRWMLAQERRGEESRALDAPSLRNRAVAAAGVLGVFGVTRDATLKAPADRAVRRLARDASKADGDRPALSWALKALEKARDLGFGHLDESIRDLEERLALLGGPRNVNGLLPSSAGTADERADDASACTLALRLLDAHGGIALAGFPR